MPPTGTRLTSQHPNYITFALAPNFPLWEVSTKPPGVSFGGENETTTQRNNVWRSYQPKHLRRLTPLTGRCSYAASIFTNIHNIGGKNQLITRTFSDGATLAFWGWLDTFEPEEDNISEDGQPTATFTVIPSNQDNTGAEVAPVFTAGTTTTSGTTTTVP